MWCSKLHLVPEKVAANKHLVVFHTTPGRPATRDITTTTTRNLERLHFVRETMNQPRRKRDRHCIPMEKGRHYPDQQPLRGHGQGSGRGLDLRPLRCLDRPSKSSGDNSTESKSRVRDEREWNNGRKIFMGEGEEVQSYRAWKRPIISKAFGVGLVMVSLSGVAVVDTRMGCSVYRKQNILCS